MTAVVPGPGAERRPVSPERVGPGLPQVPVPVPELMEVAGDPRADGLAQPVGQRGGALGRVRVGHRLPGPPGLDEGSLHDLVVADAGSQLDRSRGRWIGVQRDQQRHLLAGGTQPLRHLVGDRGTVAAPGQDVGTVGPGLADPGEVALGHLLDAAVEKVPAVEPAGLEAVEGLLGGEPAGEVREADQVAVAGADHEQGRPRAVGLQWDQVVPALDRRVGRDLGGESLRRRGLEDRRQRQSPAGDPLELVEEGDREQRVSSESEEVVFDPHPLDSSARSKALTTSRSARVAGLAPAGGRQVLRARCREAVAVDLPVGIEG